jgi:hypothetical protein
MCVTLQNNISRIHISHIQVLVILLFCNPRDKTVTGTAYMWELLIANHLDFIVQGHVLSTSCGDDALTQQQFQTQHK